MIMSEVVIGLLDSIFNAKQSDAGKNHNIKMKAWKHIEVNDSLEFDVILLIRNCIILNSILRIPPENTLQTNSLPGI